MNITSETVTDEERARVLKWLIDPASILFLELVASDELRYIAAGNEKMMDYHTLDILRNGDVGPEAKALFAKAARVRIALEILKEYSRVETLGRYKVT